MPNNYFLDTKATEWTIDNAVDEEEKVDLTATTREILKNIQKKLMATSNAGDADQKVMATDWLSKWKSIKKLIKYGDKEIQSCTNMNQCGIIIMNTGAPINIYQNVPPLSSSSTVQQPNSSNTQPPHGSSPKRSRSQMEEGEDTVESSRRSKEEGRKHKALRVYIRNSYKREKLTDIWKVENLNLTAIFSKYRQDAIKGAQTRKHLSDGRVLSLSYIFLLSSVARCSISLLSSEQQRLIFSDMKIERHYKHLDDNIIIAFRKIQCAVPRGKQEVENLIDNISMKDSNAPLMKQSMKVARDLVDLFTEKEKYPRKGEAKFTIEIIKPFLKYIINDNMDVLIDWMSYHLKPLKAQPSQVTLVPDFVVYTEPYSNKNFELMFLEVKKQGKQANVYESDVIKLGKEMKIAVDKLVNEGVGDAEVVGILVEGLEVRSYKMDLKYDGQYRMCVLNTCYLFRKGAADVLLVPTCIEFMMQVEKIVNDNIMKLQDVLDKKATGEHLTNDKKKFIRDSCGSPCLTRRKT